MPAGTPGSDRVFAWVDEQPLYAGELHAAFTSILRKKYYHGQVPQDQMAVVMKEAQDQVIDAFLLNREVKRQAIEPDRAAVEAELAKYEARYQGSPQWQENRANVLPGLRAELERRSRLQQLEARTRVVSVDESEVRAFYAAKPELFTEPEKIRLQTILLSVDPSSPATVRQSARDEAQRIVSRLRSGADFAETARLHSHDASAAAGGEMDYIHRGMLPEGLQGQLDKLGINEISDPINVLEGVAIIRVMGRMPEKLRTYEEVAERARGLVERERQDQRWADFLGSLRSSASIRLGESPAPTR